MLEATTWLLMSPSSFFVPNLTLTICWDIMLFVLYHVLELKFVILDELMYLIAPK